MSQARCSSQIRCRCGIIAKHFTSSTPYNPGRKFYKCSRPKANSCGFWEWEDEIFPRRDWTNIKDVTSSIEEIKMKMDKLNEEVIVMKAIHQYEVDKVVKLEDKLVKTRMLLMISWGLFIGYFVASMMK
uniref:Uncharacterized protein LOC104241920 n=1 Tax=Nicotiana sylvestris TaxID=4096 RepID=A0A1U7Y7G3_NICSY|nr:PREDICTED: uncharacterized protein LOC104241920 [Nicotiana sylvestris]